MAIDPLTGKPYDYNNEPMIRPKAWKHMKEGIGTQFEIRELMEEMEKMNAGHTARLDLANALYHWVRIMTDQDRQASKDECYRREMFRETREEIDKHFGADIEIEWEFGPFSTAPLAVDVCRIAGKLSSVIIYTHGRSWSGRQVRSLVEARLRELNDLDGEFQSVMSGIMATGGAA